MRHQKVGTALVLSAGMLLSVSGCGRESGSDQGDRSETYEETVTYSEDGSVDGASFVSEGKDENAIVVADGNVSLADITVRRDSQDSSGGDDASFYGTGAAILSKGGTATIRNADISTDAKGGTGVFAYGDGVVKISDSTISTVEDTSGAVHAAGGGTL